jgi:hypothetical protein
VRARTKGRAANRFLITPERQPASGACKAWARL